MLACDYLRIINFLDGEFIMSETIKVQLEETVENKLRALNGYLEYIQKMSFGFNSSQHCALARFCGA